MMLDQSAFPARMLSVTQQNTRFLYIQSRTLMDSAKQLFQLFHLGGAQALVIDFLLKLSGRAT